MPVARPFPDSVSWLLVGSPVLVTSSFYVVWQSVSPAPTKCRTAGRSCRVPGTAFACDAGTQSLVIDWLASEWERSAVRRLFVRFSHAATRRWFVVALLAVAAIAAPV